jgi:hypothetical protein
MGATHLLFRIDSRCWRILAVQPDPPAAHLKENEFDGYYPEHSSVLVEIVQLRF